MTINMLVNDKDLSYCNSNNMFLSKNIENYFILPWSISKIEDELVLHLSSHYDAEIQEKTIVLSTTAIAIIIL